MHRPFQSLLLGLALLTAIMTGCSGVAPASLPANAAGQTNFRSKCVPLPAQTGDNPFDDRPAQRITHIKNKGNVALDDSRGDLNTNRDSARLAHSSARVIDLYFTKLRRDGFGLWSGCYGGPRNQKPQMESVVDYYPGNGFLDFITRKPFAGWQSDLLYVLYNRWFDISEEAVFHEWTHALVDNTIGLCGQDSVDCHGNGEWGETGALYESLAEVFAFLVSGRSEMGVGATKRSLANPPAYGGADHADSYFRTPGRPVCDEKNTYCEKYKNAGIPDKAAYLMVNGGQDVLPPVRGLGREKVARIYFHALNPDYLSNNADFNSFAGGILAACGNLSKDTQRTGIDADDCTQVKTAFTVVGMLLMSPAGTSESPGSTAGTPEPEAALQPSATPTVRILPTSTPQTELLQQVSCKDVRALLNINNLTRWPIKMVELKCTGHPQKYNIIYPQAVLEPGEKWSVTWIDYLPCTIELAREGKPAVHLTLPVPAKGYCYQVTLRESDFR